MSDTLQAGKPDRFRAKSRAGRSLGALLGCGSVALLTLAAFRLRLNLTTAAFLHLIIVLLVARHSSFLDAVAVSVVAVACQLYFFVPPVMSWSVADPRNWVALIAFVYCSWLVSQLSASAVQQRQIADSHRRDLEGLCEVSRQVLLIAPGIDGYEHLAELIASNVPSESVIIFDAVTSMAVNAGAKNSSLESATRNAYFAATDSYCGLDHTWLHVLVVGGRAVGALGLQGSGISLFAANGLRVLVATAFERSRIFETEQRAEALRHGEQLRGAVLDSLAHDVKTPLTAIRTAASGLLSAGNLSAWQTELLEIIDGECARINELTSRLLRMARLDGKELLLNKSRISVREVLDQARSEGVRRTPSRRFRVAAPSEEAMAVADRELLTLAISQLIDNARNYSDPDTEITLGFEHASAGITLYVHNFGDPVPPCDTERIFQRFYRAPGAATRAAGTGLGLPIARKIAIAHGGRLWATSDREKGTTFFLSLPAGTHTGS